MLTEKMMWIADHPSDPWLETYLKEQGWSVFKYGEAKPVTKEKENKTLVKTSELAESKVTPKEFDAQDTLIKHLASKVKV